MEKRELREFLETHAGYLKKSPFYLSQRFKISPWIAEEVLKKVKEESINQYAAKPAGFKRLFFDIETSPNLVYSWNVGRKISLTHDNLVHERAVICICYKWEGDDTVFSLTWNKGDDKQMLETFTKVLNSADEIVGHNCVEINTPILTHDLKWVPAGSLSVGAKLAGFEEGVAPGKPCRDTSGKWNGEGVRKLKNSEVTNFQTKFADCVKITFNNGDSVITTKDHYWLSLGNKDNNNRWRSSSMLKIGDRVTKYFTPWTKDTSYDGGWLSGFISGEGTLKGFKDNEAGLSIDFCQRPGVTWNKALEVCKTLKLDISSLRKPKNTGIGKGDCLYTGINGGKFKILEIIGKYDISRFIEKINWDNLGMLKGKNLQTATVIKIEDVGQKEVAVFSTTTKTFFGAGYPMHNCDQFDTKWLRGRCLYHNIQMYPDYTSIDTLKLARKVFRLNSNRLDYIAKYLGVGKKTETGGFDLWKEIVLNNNKESLEKMVNYCKNDVVILEKVFNKINNYVGHTTHRGVALGKSNHSCPECGGTHSVSNGQRITATGIKKQRLQCQDCGKYFTITLKKGDE